MNYLITGAGTGIGRAIAIEIAKHGHTCFLMGRNEKNLQETLALLENGEKGEHQIFCADITDAVSLKTVVDNNAAIVLDGIIANAGIGGENNFGE